MRGKEAERKMTDTEKPKKRQEEIILKTEGACVRTVLGYRDCSTGREYG